MVENENGLVVVQGPTLRGKETSASDLLEAALCGHAFPFTLGPEIMHEVEYTGTGASSDLSDDAACTADRGSSDPAVLMTAASRDVLAERSRQQTVEGHTAAGDDRYRAGELGAAATCLVAYHCLPTSAVTVGADLLASAWPWAPSYWKPKTAREDLVKAGALILAELERLDRLSPP